MGSYFQGGSPSNYTIGGLRFWFSRLVDDSVSPVQYEGYQDFGNVVNHNFEQTVDELDHFSSRSGNRVKDRNVVRELSEALIMTFDELSIDNLRTFFRGAAMTAVAESLGGGAVVDEVHKVRIGEYTVLGKGYNASAIVVKDVTGAITYATPDDYTVEDHIGGFKRIVWAAGVAGDNLVDGQIVRINYTYDIRAHRKFSPGVSTEILGTAVIFGVSRTGNEFIRPISRCSIQPEGQFALSDEDWSEFQLRLDILDNSEADAVNPFGIFEHYGKGTDL